jgi:putative ABC transport system ATP-binding protein
MIILEDVTKVYQVGTVEFWALKGISLQVDEGEFIAIMGPSGSGKSTLMNLIGALDVPTSGRYILDGVDVADLDDYELAEIRNRKIGFVFQSFNLIARTTALHNVEMPLIYAGVGRVRHDRAMEALRMVGLEDWAGNQPTELSGGQQQRVAIARALVTDPAILLADEPTGNLDSGSSREIMRLLVDLNHQGRTVVLITHEPDVAKFARRVVHIRDGLVESDETRTAAADPAALPAGAPPPFSSPIAPPSPNQTPQ